MSAASTRIVALAAAALTLGAAPSAALAQEARPVRQGDLVRLRLSHDDPYVQGRLLGMTATELSLTLAGADAPATYPLGSLVDLEVHAGGGARGILEAAGLGWLGGMATAELYLLLTEGAPWAEGAETTFLSGSIGGLVAGLLWGAYRQNRWEPVALERLAAVEGRPEVDRAAAEADFARARDWVRARTSEGRQHEGAVRSIDAGGLAIRRTDGELTVVTLASLERLEVHRGQTRRPLIPMAQGLVGGAILGAVIGFAADRFRAYGCAVGSCGGESRVGAYVRRGAIEGLVAGVLVGLVRPYDLWEDVPVAAASDVLIAPGPAGSVSFGVTLRGERR